MCYIYIFWYVACQDLSWLKSSEDGGIRRVAGTRLALLLLHDETYHGRRRDDFHDATTMPDGYRWATTDEVRAEAPRCLVTEPAYPTPLFAPTAFVCADSRYACCFWFHVFFVFVLLFLFVWFFDL